MALAIDEGKCIGCGLCENLCSQAFKLGANGKAQVKNGQENSKEDCVKEAIESCPTQAISKD